MKGNSKRWGGHKLSYIDRLHFAPESSCRLLKKCSATFGIGFNKTAVKMYRLGYRPKDIYK